MGLDPILHPLSRTSSSPAIWIAMTNCQTLLQLTIGLRNRTHIQVLPVHLRLCHIKPQFSHVSQAPISSSSHTCSPPQIPHRPSQKPRSHLKTLLSCPHTELMTKSCPSSLLSVCFSTAIVAFSPVSLSHYLRSILLHQMPESFP